MERYGEWFAIETGELAGQPSLAGWRDRPIASGQVWVALSECPRCAALVQTPGKFYHEQWHAKTDYPVTPEVLAEIGRLMQEAARRG